MNMNMNMQIHMNSYLLFGIHWSKGEYTEQRYGQAFCNCFNITDPMLFYETDRINAEHIITSKYLVE